MMRPYKSSNHGITQISAATFLFVLLSTNSEADPSISVGGLVSRLQRSIDEIIDRSTENGSLFTNKVARDLQLQISALKENLHDEMDSQFDNLNASQTQAFNNIDKVVAQLNGSGKQLAALEGVATLDVQGLLDHLPFANQTFAVRSVEGATQFFHGKDGIYRASIRANFWNLPFKVLLLKDGKPSELPSSWSLSPSPPYDMVLTMAGDELSSYFADNKLSMLKMSVMVEIPNRRWFEFWKARTRVLETPVVIELLPKYPIVYQASQYRPVQVLDLQHPRIQRGQLQFVPSCGHDGCNEWQNVCVDVPEGAIPIEQVDPFDSKSGWGSWDAFWKTKTGMCGRYHQHSENLSRDVSFNVSYMPLLQTYPKFALPFNELGSTPSLSIMNHADCITSTHFDETWRKDVCESSSNEVSVGRLSYGVTYTAILATDTASFDFVGRSFTGEVFAATKNTKSDRIEISDIEKQGGFRRVTLRVKPPW